MAFSLKEEVVRIKKSKKIARTLILAIFLSLILANPIY